MAALGSLDSLRRWRVRLRRLTFVTVAAAAWYFVWRFELFTVPADFEGLDGCPADARYLCDRRAGGAPGLLDLLATGGLFRGTVVYYQVPAHEGILLGRLYGLPGDRLEPAADGRLRLVFADGGTRTLRTHDWPAPLEPAATVIPEDRFLILLDEGRAPKFADSRVHGLIPRAWIRGRLLLAFHSPFDPSSGRGLPADR